MVVRLLKRQRRTVRSLSYRLVTHGGRVDVFDALAEWERMAVFGLWDKHVQRPADDKLPRYKVQAKDAIGRIAVAGRDTKDWWLYAERPASDDLTGFRSYLETRESYDQLGDDTRALAGTLVAMRNAASRFTRVARVCSWWRRVRG